MTHFLQQGYTYSNKATPPNIAIVYELMGAKYIQTATGCDLNVPAVAGQSIDIYYLYVNQQGLSALTTVHSTEKLYSPMRSESCTYL